MSILDRLKGAWRGFSAATGGVSDLRNPTAWLQDTIGVTRTTSGVPVTPTTSMTVGAYFRAIALVSASVAKMPVRVVRVNGKRRDIVDGHAIARLLNTRPNNEVTGWDFRETMTQWALGHGNGIAVIDRDRNGNPIALWQRPPGEIRLVEDDRLPLGDPLRVYYEWNNRPGSGSNTVLMTDDVLHVKGMGTGLWGYSVAQFMARTTGEAIAQSEHGGAFFGNGARPGGIVSFEGSLSPDARKNIRTGFSKFHEGSENAYRWIVAEEGAKYTPLTMPMQDAQFLEQRKFSVTEIARWFGTPPHKLGDLEHATFSNIEHQAIEYVQDAVMPWACRWEGEAHRKLLGPRSGLLEVDFDEEALIRGDSVQRAERARTAISTGVMTPNEGRVELGMNPVNTTGSDDLYLQGAMATLEAIADPPEPPPPVIPVAPELPEDDDDDDAPEPPAAEAVAALFQRAAARVCRRETRAVTSAAKRDRSEFVAWANDWYVGHRDFVRDEFAPLLNLYADPDWDGFNQHLSDWLAGTIKSAADHHTSGDLAEWMESYEPERASELARALHNTARGIENVEA